MFSQKNVLAGTYEIIEEIGRGGNGIVYLAIHRRLQIYVVIKKIRDDVVDRVRIRQEADLLKNLKHPYLPRIYDFVETYDGIYTVMDYVDGIDMERALQQWGSFTESNVRKWALQLGEALDYLHRQNPPIIHSDIKPSNIMLTNDGNICLIDFNISLALGGNMGNSIGVSPGFSPPEQYTGFGMYNPNPVNTGYLSEDFVRNTLYSNPRVAPYVGMGITPKSDIYSLGMCLVTFLTGSRPDPGFNNYRIEDYGIQISEGFATIIDNMTEIAPSDRYANGTQYLEALRNCRKLDRRYISMRRRQLGMSLTASVLFVIGAILTVFGIFRLNADRHTEYYSIIEEADAAISNMNSDEAARLINEAIEKDSTKAAAYKEDVYLRYMNDDFEGCIELGEKYIRTTPFYIESAEDKSYLADIYYLVGNAYFELGKNAEALSLIKMAIENDASNPLYFRDCAVITAMNGDADKAEAYIKEASSLGLNDLTTELVEAEINHKRGNEREALSIVKGLIQETDDKVLLRRSVMLCSDIYKNIGDSSIDDEIDILTKALNKSDKGSRIMVSEYLSNAYSRKAALYPEISAECYRKAISLLEDIYNEGYSTYRVMENIGVLYENMGDLENAESFFLKMLDKYPDNYSVYIRLAFLEADKQQNIDITYRNYDKMMNYYDKAVSYCNKDDDVDMQLLNKMVDDIKKAGWY